MFSIQICIIIIIGCCVNKRIFLRIALNKTGNKIYIAFYYFLITVIDITNGKKKLQNFSAKQIL